MDNQEIDSKELTEETPKTRKRKLLTEPERVHAKCKVCKEAGNLENMVRHQLPVKDKLEASPSEQYLILITKHQTGKIEQKQLIPVRFVPLL